MVHSSYQERKNKTQPEISNGACVTPTTGWLAIKWNMQWECNICFWSLHRWLYECSHPIFYHLL